MERLAHGAGRFVGVSGSGEVYGSTNGMSWESMGAVPGAPWPERMIYGGGQFVLLTAEPKTWVSANGLGWAAGPVPEGVGWVRGLSYGEGRYVMVTDAGQALVSTNGLNWGSVAVISGGFWTVAYGDGRFVAVGERPGTEGEMERLVAESTDGETWVVEANTNLVSGSELAYGAGRFVLGGWSGIWTLERGQTGWEVTQVSVLNTERVRYEGGRFVGTSYELIQTSENGLAWSAPTANHRYLVYGDGEFVVMSDNGGWSNWGYAILSSPDGRAWVPRTSGSGWARGLARGEEAYVAAVGGSGSTDYLMRSTNLADWQQVEPGLGNSPGKHRYVNGLTYGVGRFVAVGRRYDEANGENAGVVWTSEDGTDWDELDLVRPGTMTWVSAWRDEVVVRGDDYARGPVAFSTVDGRNWMTMTLEDVEPQIAVQGLWPVETGVGSGLVWLGRGDGAWDEYDLPGDRPAMGLAYGSGFLLAVGERGTVWKSSPLVGFELLGWTAGGELRLGITGPAGASYDLERSADLQQWTWVVNVQTKEVRHEVLLTDAVGGGPSFYRLVMK